MADFSLSRRVAAEFLGTALLVATVVGVAVMAGVAVAIGVWLGAKVGASVAVGATTISPLLLLPHPAINMAAGRTKSNARQRPLRSNQTVLMIA